MMQTEGSSNLNVEGGAQEAAAELIWSQYTVKKVHFCFTGCYAAHILTLRMRADM